MNGNRQYGIGSKTVKQKTFLFFFAETGMTTTTNQIT